LSPAFLRVSLSKAFASQMPERRTAEDVNDQPPRSKLGGPIGVLRQDDGLNSLIAAAISSRALLALGVTPMKCRNG